MTTPQERADGVIFDEARKAGYEDGNDFKVSDGPGSCSPRMQRWLYANFTELMLNAWEAWNEMKFQ